MKDLLSIYRLSPDDVERFDITFGGEFFTKEALEESTVQWRSYMEAEDKTLEDCRRHFLQTMIVRNEVGSLPPMEDLPTAARYLCMRAEQSLLERSPPA